MLRIIQEGDNFPFFGAKGLSKTRNPSFLLDIGLTPPKQRFKL